MNVFPITNDKDLTRAYELLEGAKARFALLHHAAEISDKIDACFLTKPIDVNEHIERARWVRDTLAEEIEQYQGPVITMVRERGIYV
jgi:hypothetical protein|tara:strand:+ start:369 stop:629 length:261 start_codon:yes stop_codon:yes gene_type:complete